MNDLQLLVRSLQMIYLFVVLLFVQSNSYLWPETFVVG